MGIPLIRYRKESGQSFFVFCHKQKNLSRLIQISLPTLKSMHYSYLIFSNYLQKPEWEFYYYDLRTKVERLDRTLQRLADGAHGKKIEKVAWNGAAPQRTNPLYTAESNHEPSEVTIILLKRWFSNATTTTRIFYQDSPCDHFSFSALVQYFLLELYLIFYLRELGDLLHSGFRYALLPSCMIILLNYILLYIILNNLSIPPPRDRVCTSKSGVPD